MNINPKNNNHLWALACIFLAAGSSMLFGFTLYAFASWCGFFIAAVILLADWWFFQRTKDRIALNNSDPDSPVVCMRLYLMMTAEDRLNLQNARIVHDHVMNFEDPLDRWFFPVMPEGRQYFTNAEVMIVWNLTTTTGTPPVNSWSDGTRQRDCAITMVRTWIQYHYLKPAAGNLSAQFIDGGYENAKKSLGLEYTEAK